MISAHLFVYGTLMRGFDHPMAKLLSRSAGFWGPARCQGRLYLVKHYPGLLLSANADFLGSARCRGRLYLVKHYPGLVLSDDPAEVVFGELYRLRTGEALLATLDEYEGCGPNVAQPQYLRQLLPVTCDDGKACEAWTYVYNRPVTALKRIPSGRFLER